MTEYGVTVLFLLEMNGRMKMVLHLQVAGDRVRLVFATGTGATNIQFLQCHHVGIGTGNDPGDSPGRELPVQTDTAVHVPGHHPQLPGPARLSAPNVSRHCRRPAAEVPQCGLAQVSGTQIIAPYLRQSGIGRQQAEGTGFTGRSTAVGSVLHGKRDRLCALAPAEHDQLTCLRVQAQRQQVVAQFLQMRVLRANQRGGIGRQAKFTIRGMSPHSTLPVAGNGNRHTVGRDQLPRQECTLLRGQDAR